MDALLELETYLHLPGMNRSSRQKICRNTIELNNIVSQLDLTDI